MTRTAVQAAAALGVAALCVFQGMAAADELEQDWIAQDGPMPANMTHEAWREQKLARRAERLKRVRASLRPEPMPALQSPLMAPHVAAYACSYLILVFAAFGIGRRFTALGFFLMTAGLVTGAVWGKVCWGDYWQYDPKEMWGLATWLAYLAYFAVGDRPRLQTALRILGALLIVLTATVANYSRIFAGVHSYA